MKNLLKSMFVSGSTVLLFASEVLANGDGDHPAGTPHTEAARIDPTMVIGIVIFLVIGGLILWKFVLHNPKSTSRSQSPLPDKTPPTQEKTVSQSGENDGSQRI